MARRWTFGQKLTGALALMLVLVLGVSVVAVVSLSNVVSSKDDVIDVDAQLLVDAQVLNAATHEKSSAARGFFLTGEEQLLDRVGDARRTIASALDRLRDGVSSADERARIDEIEVAEAAHQRAVDDVIASSQAGASVDVVAEVFEDEVEPLRDDLGARIDEFVADETAALAAAREAASDTASAATLLVIVIGVGGVIAAAVLALVLGRALKRQIGSAVGEVQSSSAELQATATQQASGAKEQASAMTEISTTISELLATSRQIAESAERVAQVAEQTAAAGRVGEDTVGSAQDSVVDIRRQMDLVVHHMLELGEKSQQIGAVLEIVSELAEQTNILAINSTIEAAGAGEAGKRFSVVADEIRKLADRVAESTKEVRGLIDDVRGAVNTTVMATEIGSKAVDAGTRQFTDVAMAFGQIASLAATTTDAAREIELSTKQQATAVEQVNVAITNVAQATKETEASSSQTLLTASALTTLSRDLLRLVESPAVTSS